VILLPIVERELRVAARKPVTYWARAAAGLVAGALTLWTLQALGDTVGPAQIGARVFGMLSRFGFLACLLMGVLLTADCLSREKREGTLGLLFLTKLSSFDVALGKLAATSLHAVFGLLGGLPMLALPLLLGGVTAGEYGRLALVLLNTLWFSLAIGLFVSAVSWHHQRAMAGTAAWVLLAGIGLPFMGNPWEMFSPLWSLRLALDPKMQPLVFAKSLALAHGCGWGFFLLANWLVLRSWREPGPSAMESETYVRSVQLDHPGLSTEENAELTRLYGGVHRSERPAMLDRNPVEWLAGGRPRWIIWAVTALAVLICLLGNVAVAGAWESSAMGVVALLGLHAVLKCWVAWEASRRFTEERRTGLLELILITPLDVSDILRGHLQSLRHQFEGPVLAVLGFDLLLLLMGVEVGRKGGGVWILAILALMMMFLVDLAALAWLGLWLGLRTGKAGPGALQALLRVMGLPTVVAMGMIAWVRGNVGFGEAVGWLLLVSAWVAVGLGGSIWFALQARLHLHRDFRQLAAGGWTTNRRAVSEW
jgi:hypothetical protein